MFCGHMRKIHHRKSVVTPVPCEKSYLKMATDGSAGIKLHSKMELSGSMPTHHSYSYVDVLVCTFPNKSILSCVFHVHEYGNIGYGHKCVYALVCV